MNRNKYATLFAIIVVLISLVLRDVSHVIWLPSNQCRMTPQFVLHVFLNNLDKVDVSVLAPRGGLQGSDLSFRLSRPWRRTLFPAVMQ